MELLEDMALKVPERIFRMTGADRILLTDDSSSSLVFSFDEFPPAALTVPCRLLGDLVLRC